MENREKYMRGNNWYFDYFKKCFPLAPAYNPLANEFYKILAEKMIECGLLSYVANHIILSAS